MSKIHQIVIGALNPSENCFSIGSVDGLNFIACAVGADVVILAQNFERVQVIPGSEFKNEEIVNSVNCCVDSGKIAICYGNTIRLLDPVLQHDAKPGQIFSYRWMEVQNIVLSAKIDNVQWVLDGFRFLAFAGLDLVLYQHKMLSSAVNEKPSSSVKFTIALEEDSLWEVIWSTKLAAKIKYVKFSSDGSLFATCGESDNFVKIWYQLKGLPSFSFIYIQHPAPVCGFEWRRSSRYMPRKWTHNTLITWCEDNTSRIWKEIPSQDTEAEQRLGDAVDQITIQEKQKLKKFAQKHAHVKKAKRRLVHKLMNLMNDKRVVASRTNSSRENGGSVAATVSGTAVNMIRSSTLADFAIPSSAGHSIVFSLAATIDAENDCFLVPSMGSSLRTKRPFTVHWLNNKELMFTHGAQRILADALLNEQFAEGGVGRSRSRASNLIHSARSSVELEVDTLDAPTLPHPTTAPNLLTVVNQPPNVAQAVETGKDVLDVKLEHLVRQWNKSYDVLFSVHPVDGSLLTWTLEWLDDQWRQPTVSFASRFPDAFPLTDASSLNASSLNTFNPHDPVYSELLYRQVDPTAASRHDDSPNENFPATKLRRSSSRSLTAESAMEPRMPLQTRFLEPLNTILLLTSHENGSLNLWRLSMDEHRQFTTILNVVHQSRMCGHRFHISQIVAHPMLSLLLTASQFTPSDGVEKLPSATAKESELILWRATPVGPLCKTGGLRELARMSSNSPKAFTCLAWIPSILPSSVLGTICNSPSSCFIASNNGRLCVFQAIIDARTLLSQINSKRGGKSRDSSLNSLLDVDSELVRHPSPRHSRGPHLAEMYNVVSTQSAAKPGCVLYVDNVVESEHSSEEIILLQIFDERLVLGSSISSCANRPDDEAGGPKQRDLLDKYLMVMVVRSEDEDRLRMWSLSLSAQPVSLSGSRVDPADENNTLSSLGGGHKSTAGEEAANAQMFYPTAESIVPSAAKLCVYSEKVYDRPLGFGRSARVLSCVPSAGHLPSASLYPACRAPYTLMLACSDDKTRFLRCVRHNAPKNGYEWLPWKMVNDAVDSSLEMDGEIFGVSSAHSGRFACAFKGLSGGFNSSGRAAVSLARSLEMAVFECESSGGVEWLHEDTFSLEKCLAQTTGGTQNAFFGSAQFSSQFSELAHGDQTHSEATDRVRGLVRIDWVSTENGTHLLTVGMGPLIYLFAQVSQDTAQHNIVLMKEHEPQQLQRGGKRAPLRKNSSLVGSVHAVNKLVRWMCIRTLELQSADGLPPLPTAISWVRDGLLIVGMKTEMRVYNQWNLSTSAHQQLVANRNGSARRIENKKSEHHLSGAGPSNMVISRSHSMLDQLNKRPMDHQASVKIIKELMVRAFSASKLQSLRDQGVLEAVSEEGLFEAARLTNPILPQYHPKQLIEMLNAGKTKRVKAILLHVLKTLKNRQVSMPNPLARAASVRKNKVNFGDSGDWTAPGDADSGQQSGQRRNSTAAMLAMGAADEENLDYEKLDTIAPLPLYALFAADNAQETGGLDKADGGPNAGQVYDSLFDQPQPDEDLDDLLDLGQFGDDSAGGDNLSVGSAALMNTRRRQSRARHASLTSQDPANPNAVFTNFLARHSRLLTEMLTHTHLPGLSSVDQMHLLAVADTISHFSSNIMDKLEQANAALQPAAVSTLGDSVASGYASAAVGGLETVDECGLRFLMAKKQHEYLLRCLPLKQRKQLRAAGLATAHIIWAFHSDTETELLGSIPCCQKGQENWDELRAFGIAWWLRNTTTLRICVEKIAKNAFQKDQDPMDASLFYLAMRKKNVLTQLFKTVNDARMFEFFREDFAEERWKKAALKNAFVLMSKQRYQHAAAFFLLGGSLKDALQIILSRLNDLQLAMVVLRLYETDPERQLQLMTELLCREVLGCSPEDVRQAKTKDWAGEEDDDDLRQTSFPGASRDPFERSMAFWIIKEYAHAAATLLEEANRGELGQARHLSTEGIRQTRPDPAEGSLIHEPSLSDIFNFYSFLRKHPLVIRQRLTNAGIQMSSTEQFLACAREIGQRVTASERRLYFRTASAHMASGCPLLALDVLSRLPTRLSSFLPPSAGGAFGELDKAKVNEPPTVGKQKAEEVDWSFSGPETIAKPATEDRLELSWSDEEDEETREADEPAPQKPSESTPPKIHLEQPETNGGDSHDEEKTQQPIDFISQHLKFIATLRIMMDELSTLASGFEVDGGQLRFELFRWLERECEVLHEICDFEEDHSTASAFLGPTSSSPSGQRQFIGGEDFDAFEDGSHSLLGDGTISPARLSATSSGLGGTDLPPLHEALRMDRIDFKRRVQQTLRRRQWLNSHQKFIQTLASYCALHSAQNYRLISVEMELLLLLLEVQRDSETELRFVNEPIPDIHSFPLLVSSISSNLMAIASPMQFVADQCTDILLSVAEFTNPPQIDPDLPKVCMLYNLCQGLSTCVYQSLSGIDHLSSSAAANATGPLTQRIRIHSAALSTEEVLVKTAPSKWPGVDSLATLLARERDADESPNLRLLLIEFFVAISMSLFSYAFTVYDSRWLFRLCAHPLNARVFAEVFGGGGERRLRSAVPVRPPPPSTRQLNDSTSIITTQSLHQQHQQSTAIDSDLAAIRAKLHAKVFGVESGLKISTSSSSMKKASPTTVAGQGASEQVVQCWVPPKKHIVQFFAEKVVDLPTDLEDANIADYDSDLEQLSDGEEDEEDAEEIAEDDCLLGLEAGGDVKSIAQRIRPHDSPNSYAWLLLRLVSVRHIQHRLRQFIVLSGFDLSDIPTISPKIDSVLKVLEGWACELEERLEAWPDGCPDGFLPNTLVDQDQPATQQSVPPLLSKYHVLIEPNNTPFEYEGRGVLKVRRLWSFLVRQDHLAPHFVRFIFARTPRAIAGVKDRMGTSGGGSSSHSVAGDFGTGGPSIFDSIKVIQREHAPILAFACNSARPGYLAVSTGRELQEMNIERALEERDRIYSKSYPTTSFLVDSNRVELDIAMQQLQRDTLRDNDDYQLITSWAGSDAATGRGTRVQAPSYINSFIVDRSRLCVKKLRKRPISGIRRLEAHSELPYYVSGSSDGSILMWEWGVDLPIFTARVAGQYAKVAKLAFAANGNRFAAVDGDGLLCIWHAASGVPTRKPYFAQKCHTKTATDVKFLGQTSTLLVTVGQSTGDQNVALWDTLMPQTKALAHSFVGHQDGATCVAYMANSQSILSGGRHGEICIWDVRQRQLRQTFRAFEGTAAVVKSLCVDPNCDVLVVGSSEGDIKVWTTDSVPQLLYSLPTEHAARGGFSLRQVGSSSVQGVQQLHVDTKMHLYSCGADNSLKLRTIPSII